MAIEKLYEGNMRKKYLFYAIPLILTSILTQSYNLINSMMIGKFIGSHAFAATSSTSPFIEFIDSAFWGYHTGVAIYIAILFGKSDYQKMLNVIKMNFFISSLISLMLGLCCNIFYRPLFNLLNISDELRVEAFSYFGTYMLGLVILQLNWGFSYIAHGLGVTKLPLLVSILSGILNVIGNFYFLSVLDMGVGGCALSTIISSGLACIIYLIKYMSIFRSLGLKLRGFKWDFGELKNSVDYGIPTMVQQLAMYSSSVVVSPLTNTCTTAAISGINIANKARSLIASIYQSSNKANTNFVAQAMGARKVDKIRQGIKTGIIQTMSMFVPVMLLFMIFARQFAHLFLDSAKDAESINYSVVIIRYLLPFVVFNVFNNLFHGIFRATGSGRLMLISTVIYSVSMVIFSYTFYFCVPSFLRIYGIYIGFALAWFTEAAFATFVYISGKWKTPEFKEMEAQYMAKSHA
ncbi:MAG: MATE family efflux transporter [Clostridia bacterium]|nr:MATE family efflux transporter [Clostridia bacterium]